MLDRICILVSIFQAILGGAIGDESLHGQDVYDDIRLTPEQQLMLKMRGFYQYAKWPLVNGTVTVPYYFDPRTIPVGDNRRAVVTAAAEAYRLVTCINFVETSSTDRRRKIRISRGKGCWSYIGMLSSKDNDLSLGDSCDKVAIALHEMGHSLGLFHTQNRPDRDDYVKIWMKNIQPGYQNNFQKGDSETFGVPYDYLSMMHYKNYFFSSNGFFTLTPTNPFAMFVMGQRLNKLRYSDAALVNRGYFCDAIFESKCPKVECLNGGYIGKNCSCFCPENTSGDRCQTVTGPFFSYTPLCGGEITSPGNVTSLGYPKTSTMDECIFSIKAPACQLPKITLKKYNMFYSNCNSNKLAIQTSDKNFGLTVCSNNVVAGKSYISDSNQAAIYYYTTKVGVAKVGFEASIEFIDGPSC